MILYLSERENSVEQIDVLCKRLFDAWCEARSVMPLSYLLKGWPLRDSEPTTIRRLGNVLRELRKHRPDALAAETLANLYELSDCIDEFLAY